MDDSTNVLEIKQKLPKIEVDQGTVEYSSQLDSSDSDEDNRKLSFNNHDLYYIKNVYKQNSRYMNQ
ncbi:unnamed protein product [Schistosoma rodhaini]|nr:unnamed protein product [Schistosoma rodhaini]